MDDIGRMVGLNKASLYYYYKNKEAIFCEIIEAEGEGFLTALKAKIDVEPEWDLKIQMYFVQRQRYFRKTANLNNLSIQTADQLRFQPMFETLASRFADRETGMVAEILDHAIADGQIRQVDTRRTAAVLLSLANSIRNDRFCGHRNALSAEEPDAAGVEADIRFGVTLILDGLRSGD